MLRRPTHLLEKWIWAKSLQSFDQLSMMLPYLRNNGDVRHRMNFIPLSVKRILHKSANNADMTASLTKTLLGWIAFTYRQSAMLPAITLAPVPFVTSSGA
jgi:hypothetical protein